MELLSVTLENCCPIHTVLKISAQPCITCLLLPMSLPLLSVKRIWPELIWPKSSLQIPVTLKGCGAWCFVVFWVLVSLPTQHCLLETILLLQVDILNKCKQQIHWPIAVSIWRSQQRQEKLIVWRKIPVERKQTVLIKLPSLPLCLQNVLC